jgi:hypothetical protein
MQELKFVNPELRPGVNVTVRRGRAWAEKVWPGDRVTLVAVDDPNNPVEMTDAYIVSVLIVPFLRIPREVLRREHDKSCRDLDGLFRVMRRVYNGFSADELVTVLEFRPVGDDE